MELEYTKPGPPKYEGQPKPYIKHREDEENWRKVERRNKQIHRALTDVKREPPSTFHAPMGYESLRDGQQMHRERGGRKKDDLPCTSRYVDPALVWPPVDMKDLAVLRAKEQRGVDVDNRRMQKKLGEIYASSRLTAYGQNKLLGGETVDCNERWAQRTSLYNPVGGPSTSQQPSPAKPASQRRARPASAPRASSLRRDSAAQVPKTLGVGSCAGCGMKAFNNADGPGLTPCTQCKQVLYCSETCAKTDFQSHKNVCKYYTTNTPLALNNRPPEDYWVNNAAMAAARRELKQRKHANQRLHPEDEVEEQARLEEILQRERAKEKAAMERQAHIEWRALYGLDGPRPCLYMGGKKV